MKATAVGGGTKEGTKRDKNGRKRSIERCDGGRKWWWDEREK